MKFASCRRTGGTQASPAPNNHGPLGSAHATNFSALADRPEVSKVGVIDGLLVRPARMMNDDDAHAPTASPRWIDRGVQPWAPFAALSDGRTHFGALQQQKVARAGSDWLPLS